MTNAPRYLAPEDLKTLTVEQLQAARRQNSNFAAIRFGVRLGDLSNARGNVLRIGKELKARGLTTEGIRFVKDQTGLVAAAVAPMQDAAVAQARKSAEEYLAGVVAKYEGQDLNVVAPNPNSLKDSRADYMSKKNRRNAITAVLGIRAESNMPGARILLVRNEKAEARFIDNAAEAAGASFIAYVAKLETKVGEGVTGVTVEGRLWTGSVLTVQKGDVTEKWHTQQIINYSVLGNAYNQWPTRLVK